MMWTTNTVPISTDTSWSTTIAEIKLTTTTGCTILSVNEYERLWGLLNPPHEADTRYRSLLRYAAETLREFISKRYPARGILLPQAQRPMGFPSCAPLARSSC